MKRRSAPAGSATTSRAAESGPTESGFVVSAHGRHVMVEAADGRRLICHPRGKKSQAVVGDRVRWQLTQDQSDEGVIVEIDPRRTLLYRQDEWRSKSFAANLDQLLMWIAVEPVFSEAQLTRALIAAESAGIPAVIVLNKIDLPDVATARKRLAPYVAMGYQVVETSVTTSTGPSLEAIRPLLDSKATLILGPSGAGKSTVINALVPEARAAVNEISQALNSGKHTTTHSQWYWLDGQRISAVIDSPGFQEFGLHHIAPMELPRWMPDIGAHAKGCRFNNCTHRQEPGCLVQGAAAQGLISPIRLSLYTAIFDELSESRW